MTLELLAVPPALAHIQDIRLCPAGCLGGVRADGFEPVEGLEHVIGPECPVCHGTGIDPSCYTGCCETDEAREYGAVIVIDFGGRGSFFPGRGAGAD